MAWPCAMSVLQVARGRRAKRKRVWDTDGAITTTPLLAISITKPCPEQPAPLFLRTRNSSGVSTTFTSPCPFLDASREGVLWQLRAQMEVAMRCKAVRTCEEALT
eukprot:4849351-Amphidinium_carterae.1